MVFKKFSKPEFITGVSTSFLIFTFYLLFNFNYLTNFIDEMRDAMTYRNHIFYYLIAEKNREVNFEEKYNLFNPHHILFDITGLSLHKLLKGNDTKGLYSSKSLMTSLQLRNLIISSLGLGILFFLFYKFSKKYFLSLFLILIIAFSCGYWIYSQINDTPLIHSILVVLLFFASIHFPRAQNKYAYAVFLALFHSLNVFFHQSDLLFFFVIAFIILLADNFLYDESRKDFRVITSKRELDNNFKKFKIYNLKFFFIYFIVFASVVSLVYYLIGFVYIGLTLDPSKSVTFNHIKNSTYFFNWLVLYTKIDYWGKGFEVNPLGKILIGISTYFYESNLFLKNSMIDGNFKNFFSPVFILPNLLGVLFILIFSCMIIFIIPLYRRYKFVLLAGILFFVIYFIFASWWQPDYREFWIAPMFSFWILCLLVLNFILEKSGPIKPMVSLMAYSFLFLIGFLLFYINFTGFMYPNASREFRKIDIVKDQPAIIIKKIEPSEEGR